MRSPVAISNGWAPVLASYSAITLFTSSMSAVAGSYSRSVVSPWDEKVRILAFMLGLLRDVDLRSSVEQQSAGCGPSNSYMAPFLRVVNRPRVFPAISELFPAEGSRDGETRLERGCEGKGTWRTYF